MFSYKRALDKRIFLKKNEILNIHDYLPESKSHFYTASARGGLEAILTALEFSSRDTVLLPVFLAEGLIVPF